MNVLEIVIQRPAAATPNHFPVISEYSQSGNFLAARREGVFILDEERLIQLRAQETNPLNYGTILGQALFQNAIRDGFMQARAQSQDNLRLLLVIEDTDLRSLRWERLCVPDSAGDAWHLLALDQRVLYSRYLPSLTDRRFPPIGRRDLRALVVIASPAEGNRFNLSHFDTEENMAGLRTALADIPFAVLGNVSGAIGPATLDEICGRLTEQPATILHIVAHGWFRARDGETLLYLTDAEGQVQPVTTTQFIERLDNLQGARGLPHLTFLSTCESSDARAEAVGALGGMGQRLVRDLGMPAVVAMTQRVTVATANALAAHFYNRLREHGEVDRALVEAGARLATAGDITVPALYGRLGGRPLFSDTLDRELTDKEIEAGLALAEAALPERAPAWQKTWQQHAAALHPHLHTDRTSLSQATRKEWDGAMAEINALCEEIFDRNFRALGLGQPLPPYDSRPPFRGLYPFREDDHEFFFGREQLVQRLAEKLNHHNFLSVLGPSGSGKSSVVLAGLIPYLQKVTPGLGVVYLTPGSDPLVRLENGLGQATAAASIIVIDQFEELFTLTTSQEKREAFITAILKMAEDETVIITMRADFWGECAPYANLREAMQNHQELIGPMSLTELRGAMEQQAGKVGLRFEADLSQTILDDVRGEPGAMPLLQHALLELWQQRRGRWLRTAAYRAIGGVQKAIAETAEKIYQQATDNERERIQDIFVRLTRVDEEGSSERRDTRQRVRFTELLSRGLDTAQMRDLVQRLATVRLIVTSVNDVSGQEELEVAHEALIRHWPRLQTWLDENRDMLRLRGGVRQATQEWQGGDEEEKTHLLIHRGSRLEEIEGLLLQGRLRLNEQEQAYISACVAGREAEKAREEAQRQRELEAARRLAEEAQSRQQVQAKLAEEAEARAREQASAAANLRKRALWVAAVGVVAVILAIAAGLFGVQSSRNAAIASTREAEAAHERDVASTQEAMAIANANLAATHEAEAEESGRISLSRQLAAQAQLSLDSRKDRALLLAMEALKRGDTVEARRVLFQGVTGQPGLETWLYGPTSWVQSAAASRDGQWLAAASCTQSMMNGGVEVGCPLVNVFVWSVATAQLVAVLEAQTNIVTSLAFSPDNTLLAAATSQGSLFTWSLANEAEVKVAPIANEELTQIQFVGATNKMAILGMSGRIFFYDTQTHTWGYNPIETGVAFFPDPSSFEVIPVPLFAINQAGTQLAYTNNERNLVIWDLLADQRLTTVATTGLTDIVHLYYSPNDRFLSARASDTGVITWHTNIFTRADQPDYALNLVPSSSFFQSQANNNDATLHHSLTAGSRRFDFICLQAEIMVFQTQCTLSVVEVWTTTLDTNSFTRSPVLRDLSTHIMTNGFSPDGYWLRLLTNGSDYIYQTIDVRDDTLVNEITLNTTDVFGSSVVVAAALGPADLVAFSDDTGQLFLVNTAQKQIVTTLEHESPVISMAFNPAGTALAVMTQANELVIWEQVGEMWSVRGRVQEDPTMVTLTNGVAWGLNGEPVTYHGRQVFFYAGETPTAVSFNFDIAGLAAAPTNQTLILYSYGDSVTTFSHVYFWDIRDRQMFGQLITYYAGMSIAISPDEQNLIISGFLGSYSFAGDAIFDPYYMLYSIGFPFWQEQACTLANRNLSEEEWAEIMPPGEPYTATCPTP